MLKDSFCSSPWIHLRVTYDGNYNQCRWGNIQPVDNNIQTTSLMQFYNSQEMNSLRLELLNGNKPDHCSKCYYQDKFGKVNGRVKQLNKSGITLDEFELTARSSPHYEYFLHSNQNQGLSNYYPVDLQIDLGNICNSACIMCGPRSSSRLEQDYIKLHKINPQQFKNPNLYTSWTRDSNLVNKFVEELSQIPNIRYIHFLGGETLYDPAFYSICEKLIELGISKNITVGTTTNGTIYDNRVEYLITQFKEFHLGISIESTTNLNDYVRYPSNIDNILNNINKFLSLRKHSTLTTSLRITPNIFTIYEFDKLIDYMIENNITAESCYILDNPSVLRTELLPNDIRQEVIVKLKSVINKHNLQNSKVVNIRSSTAIQQVIGDVVTEYLTFVENYTVPDDVEEQRYQLVTFLKSFETIRKNSILDYAPRYTEFLRSYGY